VKPLARLGARNNAANAKGATPWPRASPDPCLAVSFSRALDSSTAMIHRQAFSFKVLKPGQAGSYEGTYVRSPLTRPNRVVGLDWGLLQIATGTKVVALRGVEVVTWR
jgi:hypothetical protein